MDLPSDPDSLALLLVQQFLEEQGCTPALKEVERQYGLKYVPEKLPRGSMLLELVYQHLEQAAAEAAADEDEARISAETEEEALLKGGRPEFAVEHVACVQNLHSANIISICCWPGAPKFISGSGNGQVQLITFDGDLLWTQKLAGGGILSLDLHVDEREGRLYLLVGSMDGTVTVMDAQEGIVLASSKAHTKYCVRVIWGPSASTFVSASWDQSLVVHRWTPPLEGQAASIGELHREQYATAVTDAALLADQTTLVVSLRNTNFLRLFSTETQKGVGKVNMNAQGDNHVSFTASHLAVSPCGKYILVSTDGARIIMFNVADWHQSRNFFGLQIESFHQPLTTWHPSGFYFFAAAAHGQVMVFHVGSAKVVATLKAHEKNVRSLHYDKQQRCLVTGSFDRNVQIYKDAICMPALLATPAEDTSLETKTRQP